MNQWLIDDDTAYHIGAEWNTRPIEDALNKRIAELETEIDRLIEVGDELADDREYQDNLVDTWHDLVRGFEEREE